jgi:hypothetical protein
MSLVANRDRVDLAHVTVQLIVGFVFDFQNIIPLLWRSKGQG